MSKRTHFVIRTGSTADLENIVHVTNAAYAIEQDFIEGPRTTAARIAQLFSDGGFLVACPADDVERIVGSVYWKVTGNRGYFGLLAVSPSCQGQGIAKQMIQAVEQNCRQQNCMFLDITVLSVRKELFPFYRHLGFASFDIENYHSPSRQRVPLRLLRMTKMLCAEFELEEWLAQTALAVSP